MPPEPSYTTWDGTPAIFAEDKNLMRVRMGRVLHPDAWSQRPLWGTNHVVSNVILEKQSPNGDLIVRSRFHMMELRRDDVRHFAGSYMHQLKKTNEGYRIKLQRVDMTNAQAAYDYVLQVCGSGRNVAAYAQHNYAPDPEFSCCSSQVARSMPMKGTPGLDHGAGRHLHAAFRMLDGDRVNTDPGTVLVPPEGIPDVAFHHRLFPKPDSP